ncbi:hypothetical protein GOODEAATRI_011733 [Goodea atripinnis]|uniref:Uncharacterized protein n=1 Tax=Goodea atripinnis TaxID=208336 RepID=A0ABV0PXS5_9TELE
MKNTMAEPYYCDQTKLNLNSHQRTRNHNGALRDTEGNKKCLECAWKFFYFLQRSFWDSRHTDLWVLLCLMQVRGEVWRLQLFDPTPHSAWCAGAGHTMQINAHIKYVWGELVAERVIFILKY